MTALVSVPLACTFLVLLACLARERRRRMALLVAQVQAASAAQDLVRLVRLTAADLRGAAVALLGVAQNAGEPARSRLLGIETTMLDLAEALLGQTETLGADCRVQEEVIALAPVVAFAVGRVASQLGQAQRSWRLSPTLEQMNLLADRRAVHQILLRVLTSAALATGEGDCIQIAAEHAEAGWALVVQDEGAGLPVGTVRGEGRETRGLGVGLALAHTLMQAHGGTLTIVSTAGIGTRARLAFPAARLVKTPASGVSAS